MQNKQLDFNNTFTWIDIGFLSFFDLFFMTTMLIFITCVHTLRKGRRKPQCDWSEICCGMVIWLLFIASPTFACWIILLTVTAHDNYNFEKQHWAIWTQIGLNYWSHFIVYILLLFFAVDHVQSKVVAIVQMYLLFIVLPVITYVILEIGFHNCLYLENWISILVLSIMFLPIVIVIARTLWSNVTIWYATRKYKFCLERYHKQRKQLLYHHIGVDVIVNIILDYCKDLECLEQGYNQLLTDNQVVIRYYNINVYKAKIQREYSQLSFSLLEP